MPIYFLVSIGVFLSVEFCFALKIYLKGAPFYNASTGDDAKTVGQRYCSGASLTSGHAGEHGSIGTSRQGKTVRGARSRDGTRVAGRGSPSRGKTVSTVGKCHASAGMDRRRRGKNHLVQRGLVSLLGQNL